MTRSDQGSRRRPVVVISPCNVASFPEGGGHFWVYYQYVLGFRQLGWDVWWLEGFETKGRLERERSALEVFRARMRENGLGDRFILYETPRGAAPAGAPREYLGRSRDEAESVFERAELLLNFRYAISPGLLARFRRTALVDIDPGLLQLWIARGQLQVPRHDVHFTIGEGVGRPGGAIPDHGLRWVRIHPAVSLDRWTAAIDPGCEAFTTISIWDSSDYVVDEHETYENTKRAAYLEFADLPRLTGQPLELALFLRTERDMTDRADLERRGWRIRHSREASRTPGAYQDYIRRSRGEFSCAKASYVRLRTGWVSDRTVCYLASGKPVVVQHTGPSAYLPNGEGMFRFSTPRQAASAIAAINRDYERHCRAARRLAETWFDARKVAAGILGAAL